MEKCPALPAELLPRNLMLFDIQNLLPLVSLFFLHLLGSQLPKIDKLQTHQLIPVKSAILHILIVVYEHLKHNQCQYHNQKHG